MFARKLLFSSRFFFPLCVAGGAVLSSSRGRTIFAFSYPDTKDVIRGEYENKIRRDSPPEKIFEVFATEKEGDDIFMTHEDFFRSICPFSYSTKKEPEDEEGVDGDKKQEGKEEEKKGFQSKALQEFADVDKDGKISIYEYHLVTSFIQIQRSQCSQFFKDRNLTNVDKDALFGFFDFLKKSSKVKLTMASGVFDPRKFSMSKEDYDKLIQNLVNNLLDGKDSIPSSKILQIREDILKDIYRFQFDAFEQNETGQITGEDFAKNLISYMEPKKARSYFRHLEGQSFKGDISFEEFYLFQKFLLDNLETINSKIEEKGFTNRKGLKKLIEEYQKKLGLQINLNQIDIFIKVLDANGNNRIEPEEFKALVEERSSFGGGEDTSLSKPLNELKQVAIKAISKAERIWQIIIE